MRDSKMGQDGAHPKGTSCGAHLNSYVTGRLLLQPCWFIFLLLIFCFAVPESSRAELPRHDVLIIHPYHSNLHFSQAINRGISQVLLARDRNDIELHVEYLDGLHREEAGLAAGAYSYFRDKFNNQRFTVVIGVGDLVYSFLKSFHVDLFPATPVFFCGLSRQDDEFAHNDLFSGVFEASDVRATVEAGLSLFPGSRRLIVINDSTFAGRIQQQILSEELEPFQDRLEIDYYVNDPMDELQSRLARLPADSLVLLMNFTRDGLGATFSFERSCRLLAAKCKVPIFGVWEFYLAQGVIGGKMLDLEEQGARVALMALDLIHGKPFSELPPVHLINDSRFIFDYRRLKQFDITYSDLPPHSIVTKEPESVLWRNKKLGWSLLCIALALEAVVIILSVNIYRRKKSEKELEKHRNNLEELVKTRTLELTTTNKQLQEENKVRKKAEEALRESEEILHQLSVNLLTIQDNERRRISVELHDELGQSLAALKLQLRGLERKTTSGSEADILGECEELRASINQIIENVRRLSRDLSPVALDDLGIDAALEYLISNFSKLHQIGTILDLVDINHLFGQNDQRMIYRILQESLNNIGKHSGADHIFFQIEKNEGNVLLRVRDNGKGFNVDEVMNRKSLDSGMGLTAMGERVRTLGGRLDVRSEKGVGTEICVDIPI